MQVHAMDKLQWSIREAHSYPCNVIYPDTPPRTLVYMNEALKNAADRLFREGEENVAVEIIEAYDNLQDAELSCLNNFDELHKRLLAPAYKNCRDPLWRMMYDRIPGLDDSSSLMAQLILAYHQVMPAFTENMLSFGIREYAEDSARTAFHSRSFLTDSLPRPMIPELGRSCQVMEHCYGLRSVEPSDGFPHWRWAIRLNAIYHSFDLQSGQSFWLVIKANRVIQEMINEAMLSTGPVNSGICTTSGDGIKRAMQIHELIAQSSVSHWYLFIQFLEDQIQELTRPTLFTTPDQEPNSSERIEHVASERVSDVKTKISSDKNFLLRCPSLIRKIWFFLSRTSSRTSLVRQGSKVSTEIVQVAGVHDRYSFKDLPHVNYIGERANEARDTLQNNEEILGYLKDEYAGILPAFQELCNGDDLDISFRRFNKVIIDTQRRQRNYRDRIEQLLRLLKDRKTLLQQILDSESARTNRLLTEQANATADNMERIAQDTQLETVSMRVITLVTLFFLPGTFISTLMSTPIVTFESGSPSMWNGSISAGALGLFVVVSVPLAVLTFLIWWAFYLWENKKQKQKQKQKRQQPGDRV